MVLPFSEATLRITYKPPSPHKRSFTIKCQTLADRTFTIPCTAQGIASHLAFSYNKISMPSTAPGNISTCSTTLKNTSTACRNFFFDIPKDAAIEICPQSGALYPGESVRILVNHNPGGHSCALLEDSHPIVHSISINLGTAILSMADHLILVQLMKAIRRPPARKSLMSL